MAGCVAALLYHSSSVMKLSKDPPAATATTATATATATTTPAAATATAAEAAAAAAAAVVQSSDSTRQQESCVSLLTMKHLLEVGMASSLFRVDTSKEGPCPPLTDLIAALPSLPRLKPPNRNLADQ
jgi:hypothetical protein